MIVSCPVPVKRPDKANKYNKRKNKKPKTKKQTRKSREIDSRTRERVIIEENKSLGEQQQKEEEEDRETWHV